jgi:NADH-quinone oxidoreductase subunit G
MGGHLVATAPGDEPAALDSLVEHGEFGIDGNAVILVGERLATVPGALTAAATLARRTGARLAWVPRRAGDRGALETGCLPNLLPGGRPVGDAAARVDAATAWGVEHLPEAVGRDTDAILAATTAGEIGGLVVGGVDPDDLADPAAAREALAAARFVVSLELRETDVTRAADVVFPVAPASDKAGTFVTWEGRPRPFDAALSSPASLPDLRILSGIAEEAGQSLGFRTVADVRRLMEQFGPWDGERAAAQDAPKAKARKLAQGKLRLATWKQMIDNGSLQDGAESMRETARDAVARVSQATYDALGAESVTVTGDRGSWTLPVEAADLPDDTVWVPANNRGNGVLADLASPGSAVTVKGATS